MLLLAIRGERCRSLDFGGVLPLERLPLLLLHFWERTVISFGVGKHPQGALANVLVARRCRSYYCSCSSISCRVVRSSKLRDGRFVPRCIACCLCLVLWSHVDYLLHRIWHLLKEVDLLLLLPLSLGWHRWYCTSPQHLLEVLLGNRVRQSAHGTDHAFLTWVLSTSLRLDAHRRRFFNAASRWIRSRPVHMLVENGRSYRGLTSSVSAIFLDFCRLSV